MREALTSFPSDMQELWNQDLAYFRFEIAGPPPAKLPARDSDTLIDDLLAAGTIRLVPQQYEDFFGPAATNIFNSNIGLEDVSNVGVAKPDSQKTFEVALGREVVNMYDYYGEIQEASKAQVCQDLGIK